MTSSGYWKRSVAKAARRRDRKKSIVFARVIRFMPNRLIVTLLSASAQLRAHEHSMQNIEVFYRFAGISEYVITGFQMRR